MAKLKVHGWELARYEKSLPDSDDFINMRYTVSIRSDGHVMRKMTGNFKDNPYGGNGFHDWGWKLWKKITPKVKGNTLSADQIVRCAGFSLLRLGYVFIEGASVNLFFK